MLFLSFVSLAVACPDDCEVRMHGEWRKCRDACEEEPWKKTWKEAPIRLGPTARPDRTAHPRFYHSIGHGIYSRLPLSFFVTTTPFSQVPTSIYKCDEALYVSHYLHASSKIGGSHHAIHRTRASHTTPSYAAAPTAPQVPLGTYVLHTAYRSLARQVALYASLTTCISPCRACSKARLGSSRRPPQASWLLGFNHYRILSSPYLPT